MERCWPLCSRKENAAVTLWEVDIHPAANQPDLLARAVLGEAGDLGLRDFSVRAARGFLVQGEISQPQIHQIAQELLADLVVELAVVGKPGSSELGRCSPNQATNGLIHVLPKPGVTDPVAASTLAAIKDFGIAADAVVTLRKYWISGLTDEQQKLLAAKLLANDSIEQVVFGPLRMERILLGSAYRFEPLSVPIRGLSDSELEALSKERTLSLTLVELKTIQHYYRDLAREPTDIELATIAQSWSEHCSHNTITGQETYTDEHDTR